jgi:hypothetical protein
MSLVKRKKRTPEQIAATNARRAATIARKKAEVSAADASQSFTDPHGEHEPEVPKVEAKKEEPAKPLPQKLQDRIEAMAGIQDDLAKEISDFKSGEAYLEGDIPVTLHGLSGPGFNPGQRSLNFIDKKCLDPLYHFRWSHKTMVDYHRADGYEPCDHADFTRMVVARGGGHSFGKTAEGHVYSGDLIMIQVGKDWHDQLSANIRKRTAAKEGRAKNNVYAKGEKLGVDVYEGGAAMSPRMEKLLSFLEKELGPGAREAFLGA